jgi:hypothetical protein
MTIRFQADADLDGRVLKALKRDAPEIDIQTATKAGLTGSQIPTYCGAQPQPGEFSSVRTAARCPHISLAT